MRREAEHLFLFLSIGTVNRHSENRGRGYREREHIVRTLMLLINGWVTTSFRPLDSTLTRRYDVNRALVRTGANNFSLG